MTTLKLETGFFVDLDGAGDIFGDIGPFNTKKKARKFAEKLPDFYKKYFSIEKHNYVIKEGKVKILIYTKTVDECLKQIAQKDLARKEANEAQKAYIAKMRLTHDPIDLSGFKIGESTDFSNMCANAKCFEMWVPKKSKTEETQ